MSLAIFPKFQGAGFHVAKSPRFSTIVQESTSGKDTSTSLWTMPRWDFELIFDFLLQKQNYQAIGYVPQAASLLAGVGSALIADDLKALAGFGMAALGRGLTWLYDDATDNWINSQQIGVGDASTTQFQITRSMGAFTEVIQNVNGTPVQATPWLAGASIYTLNSFIIPSAVAIDAQGGRVVPGWQNLGWPRYYVVTNAGSGVAGQIEPAWRTLAPIPGLALTDNGATLECIETPLVVFLNGTAQLPSAYTLGATGMITFNSAPANGAVVTVTCGFFFQCRFAEDTMVFAELLNKWWAVKSLKFSSVKL